MAITTLILGSSAFAFHADADEENASKQKVVSENVISEGLVKFYPNPLEQGNTLYILYNVSQAQDVRVLLLDAIGNQVYQNIYPLKAGKRAITIDTDDLQSGIYFLKVGTFENTNVRKIIVK